MPMDGVSLAYTFTNPTAPSTHHIQYFELHGNRAIYDDGWLANTTPRNMPWELMTNRPNSDVTSYQWELYNLNNDPTQAHNLAAQYPDKLKQLQAVFDQQAIANNVYPIQDSGALYRGQELAKYLNQPIRTHFVFWGTGVHLPAATIPPVFAFPFTVKADIEVPPGGANGVILAGGSLFSGWSFYLKNGVPTAYAAANNYPGSDTRVQAAKALTPGTHHLEYDLAETKPGIGVLTILADGVPVAKQTVAELPVLIGNGGETLDVGRDTGAPVTTDYSHEGVFTGTIDKVTLDISPPKNASSAFFLAKETEDKSE
jgi:arylsulfatase